MISNAAPIREVLFVPAKAHSRDNFGVRSAALSSGEPGGFGTTTTGFSIYRRALEQFDVSRPAAETLIYSLVIGSCCGPSSACTSIWKGRMQEVHTRQYPPCYSNRTDPWLSSPFRSPISLGLLNTRTRLVLHYGFANIPVAFWLPTPSLRRMPLEIERSAALDGAGPVAGRKAQTKPPQARPIPGGKFRNKFYQFTRKRITSLSLQATGPLP